MNYQKFAEKRRICHIIHFSRKYANFTKYLGEKLWHQKQYQLDHTGVQHLHHHLIQDQEINLDLSQFQLVHINGHHRQSEVGKFLSVMQCAIIIFNLWR